MTEAVVDQPIASRATFDPSPPRGNGRAFTLALLAHVLLILALAWGLRWKKDAQVEAVEAELWSATAQIAAPKAAPVEPSPPPPVVAPPKPVPPPEPKPAPPVVDDSVRQAELALEQQKKEEQVRKTQEQARLQQIQIRRQQEEERQRQEQTRKAQEEQRQLEETQRRQIKAADDAAKKTAEKQRKAAQQKAQAEQAKADAARQQDNVRRAQMMASADVTGTSRTAVNATGSTPGGTAQQNSGPSAGYGARIRARVKPNITYPDLTNLRGNPQTEVEVSVAPDGTITGRRLSKSSGVPSWDNAVLRAIDKTQVLPRDVDGRVFNPTTIVFRPQD